MPNKDNIRRPVTLISNGRSGTSLTFNIFRAHPDFDVCGETAPFLFGTWYSMEKIKGVIRKDYELGANADHNLRCAKVVQSAFIAAFEDNEKTQWMHKPIGVPWTFRMLEAQGMKFNQCIKWYWDVMDTSFPDGRNITILRHPYDVVLSAAKYWGNTHANAWKAIVRMARIINHSRSNIDFGLSHARLVEDRDTEIARLLDHLNLEHHPACFEATDRVYVAERRERPKPKEAMADHVKRGFSHKDSWSEIDMSSFTQRDRDAIVAMWARFGEELTF